MRILFMSQRLPYPPNRGDRIRAYHELVALGRCHEVHVVSLAHDRDEAGLGDGLKGVAASVTAAPVPRLRNLATGIASLPTRRPLTHALLASPSVRPALHDLVKRVRPQLVFAFCSSMVRFALEEPLAGIPFVMDMVDVDSEKWRTLAAAVRPPLRWIYAREARTLGPFEAHAACRSLLTWVVNEREAVSLRKLIRGSAPVEVLPNGVDLTNLAPPTPAATSSDVVFCGVMDYAPNVQGALWMAREVWPRVRAARPTARLVLVGANPTGALRRLPGEDPSVVVTGTVPDVRPYLWSSALAVAPLLVARGIQSKVLEAVAAGLPTVVTPVVAEGLPPDVEPACRVAPSAETFAEAVIDTLALEPDRRRAMAAAADLWRLSWERQMEPMLRRLEKIGRDLA